MKLKLSKSLALALSSVMLLSMPLLGCNKEKSPTESSKTPKEVKPVTLKVVFGFADFEKPMKEIAELYKKDNPHVTVEFIAGKANELLPAMIQQNDVPDISVIPDGFDVTLGKKGLLLDLSNRPIAKIATKDNLATHTVDGKIYSISTGAGVYGIYYNKALFAKAGIDKVPTTSKELKDAVAKLKTAGIVPFVGGYKDSWVGGQYFRYGSAGVFTKNAPLTSDISGKKKKFTDGAVMPLFDKTFELIDLIKGNMLNGGITMTAGEAEAKFASGAAAMYMLGDWSMATMVKANPTAANRANTGFMPIITSDNAADNRYLVFYNAGHGIFKDSKNLDEAIKFYDYIFSKTGRETIHKGTGNPGPFSDEDMSWANEFKQDLLKEILKPEKVWTDLEYLKLPSMVAGLNSSLDGYMKGAYTKEQVFKELQKAVDTALAAQ